jgi:hypothetical protein
VEEVLSFLSLGDVAKRQDVRERPGAGVIHEYPPHFLSPPYILRRGRMPETGQMLEWLHGFSPHFLSTGFLIRPLSPLHLLVFLCISC